MEVRSGDAAGGAHLSEHLAGLQLVADFHVHFGKVAIEGINPEAVIDNHGVAGKEQFLGQRYAPALRRMNGSTGGGGEIHAAVRRAGLAVQDAALAEVAAGGHAVERHAEISVPYFLGAQLVATIAKVT